MAKAREPEAESNSAIEDVPVSRREFLSLGLAGTVGVVLLGAAGCGSSRHGGGNAKKNKKGNGGGGGGY